VEPAGERDDHVELIAMRRVIALLAVIAPPFVVGVAHAQSTAASSSASATSSIASPPPSAIASAIQSAYKGTTGFGAEFDQRFRAKAFGTEKKSRGKVIFVQPDKMRWDYDSGDVTASDGTTIRMWDATAKTTKTIAATSSHLPAVFAFLAGSGSLATTHTLSLPPKCAMTGGWCLKATPNTPTNAYDFILLYVEAATGKVMRVVVVDAQGNSNRFDLTKQNLKATASASAFTKVP
jgi:outer membrane lipoprotein carrier protein